MNRLSRLKLKPQERMAIEEFSRRVKKALGKELITIKLYGSKIRGNSRKYSDIDIYLIVRRKTLSLRHKVSEIDADIWDKYDVLLSPVIYDTSEEEKNLIMHSFYFESVQKEGIAL